MKATLDSIKPLMSITGHNAVRVNAPDENSDLKVRVEYGVTKKKKVFSGIVTKEEWKRFLNDYASCVDSFWEMGED